MAAFSQFESDLDAETKKLLNRGAKVSQILKQKKGQPYSLGEQISVIWAATQGFMDDMQIAKIGEFETRLIADLKASGKNLLKKINKNKELDAEDEKELKKLITRNT